MKQIDIPQNRKRGGGGMISYMTMTIIAQVRTYRPTSPQHRVRHLAMPMLLRLATGAYKSQHEMKRNVANADMTMDSAHFVGVLDGVSGVVDLGLQPEDLSYSLREYIRTNLRIRLQSTDKATYDNTILDFFSRPRWNDVNKAKAGEWLRNLVAYSLASCPALGATTLSVCTVVGEKMTWFNVGDVALSV